MSFNPDDEDPHSECRHHIQEQAARIRDLKSEIENLMAMNEGMKDGFAMRVRDLESEITRLRQLIERAIKGLKNIGEFHYPDDESGVEPHPLDCTLAGRVSRVLCTGMTRSCQLCHEFGEDPEFSESRQRKESEQHGL